MSEVYIHQEPVELFKILKFEGIANSGGQAKQMIEDGLVCVNGTVETRKRLKIMSGDTINIQDIELQILLQPTANPESAP